MQRHEDEAIVLETRVEGESDRRVTLLTAQGARVFGYAPSAASSRRRFGAALQPGARVRAAWTLKREGAFPVFQEATLLDEPPRPDPLERYYATAHVLELAGAFAQEGEGDPRVYRLAARVLRVLSKQRDFDELCRYVEAWTLRLAGLLPELERCAQSGEPFGDRPARLGVENGLVREDHAGGQGWPLGPLARRWLAASARLSPEDLPALDETTNEELERALCGLLVSFTERPLKAQAAMSALKAQRCREDGAPRDRERSS
jgi:DNA repair protein RecO (recombination protein O)